MSLNNWIGSDQLQKVELPEVAKGRIQNGTTLCYYRIRFANNDR